MTKSPTSNFAFVLSTFLLSIVFAWPLHAQTVTATVPAGTSPRAVAVNPETNKIYVGNTGSGNVTVIDGATNSTSTVTVGTRPLAVAVNPVTNKIYVTNYGSANVTVIDGATNSTATVAVGSGPQAVAVNPVTNKIYVANFNSNTVTVIDGATNSTATVAVGSVPRAVAVNPVTNKIYVANSGGTTVTVIDGATNSTATVPVGLSPLAVAVNPVTNKIYVANAISNNVTVIDGATNSAATVATDLNPLAVAVNPATNKIYPGLAQPDAEARILDHIRDHLKPGEPLLVTELSKVFTQPDERGALAKLYSAFFRIPLFVAQYQEKFGSPPTLKVIAEQFALHDARAADVLLRVMESDPRVPRFFTRDANTGEITQVDVEKIRNHPRYGQALAQQLSGWEGKAAPEFKLAKLDGGEISTQDLRDKVVLLYVWFTGCPPCMMETPDLVALAQEFSPRGLEIVGANADRVLGLPYDDAFRQRYVKEQRISFPVVHWTREAEKAWGTISIFPTLFLINRKDVIVQHWIGFVSRQELREVIARELKAPSQQGQRSSAAP